MHLQLRQADRETVPPSKVGPLSTREWPLMAGAMAWDGADFQSGGHPFIRYLTPGHIQEVEFAVSDFKDIDLAVPDVDRSNFELPMLAKELASGCQDLHAGKGFFVLRGFNPKQYSAEDNLLMFLGISSYIGEGRAKQDGRGNMVVHLHHDTARYPLTGVGPTRHSNKFSPFHCDHYTDIIALHVQDVAAEGGAFKMASAWSIYNKLAVSRPDLVEVLASDWTFKRRGRLFPQSNRPILFYQDGRIMMDFSRSAVSGTSRTPGGPASRLSRLQIEALEEVERIAQEDQLVFELEPGDMLFLNNHALLHSREAFRDDAEHARHIVRLWLKNSELAWKLPPELETGNRKMFYENDLRERWAVTIGSGVRMGDDQGHDSPGSTDGSH